MKIVINFDSEDLIRALAENPSLELELTIAPPSEHGATEEDLSAAEKRKKTRTKNLREINSFILSPAEQVIIDTWNSLPCIANQTNENRNLPVNSKDFPEVSPLVRKALQLVPSQKIIGHMRTYSACCVQDGHIWDRTNHAYKTLAGFLQKIMTYQKNGGIPWWELNVPRSIEVNDSSPEITEALANAFAQEFLNTEVYQLEQNSKEHAQFAQAAEWISKVTDLHIFPSENSVAYMIKYLIRCVKQLTTNVGRPAYVGHLTNKTIWTINLPQFLNENVAVGREACSQFSAAVSRFFAS